MVLPGPIPTVSLMGVATKALGGALKKVKGRKKPKSLPALDSTGKVHGELPRPKDLPKYPREDLEVLRDQLNQSVQRRIEVTSRLGREVNHGQRQGAEQALIRSLNKYLDG